MLGQTLAGCGEVEEYPDSLRDRAIGSRFAQTDIQGVGDHRARVEIGRHCVAGGLAARIPIVSETTVLTYHFGFADGNSLAFPVELRRPTLDLVSSAEGEAPEWTALAFRQCPNCSLNAGETAFCPVARNLAPIADAFGDFMSYDQTEVSVHAETRVYRKACSLQEGISSLMGLIMATSGCPHLDKLRPMVFTHLPFATSEETTYRAVSMYLLAQFFRQRCGKKPDWGLEELSRIYDDVRSVNMAFAKRLASLQDKDANRNAIVQLDSLARTTSFSIDEQWWEDIEWIFRPFLGPIAGGSSCVRGACCGEGTSDAVIPHT